MGVEVDDVLGALRAEELDPPGDWSEAAETYRRREGSWVDLADHGFARLDAVERAIVDLTERVAWIEGRVACAGGFVASAVDQVRGVVAELREELGHLGT